uniref:Uncharacterized protein n=1 Tax=Rhizophora mucronata TaxID=61149 RepID=A0A2P2J0J8_RHIMU
MRHKYIFLFQFKQGKKEFNCSDHTILYD